jgi:predicted GIY-YIG superfamily endonuclease
MERLIVSIKNFFTAVSNDYIKQMKIYVLELQQGKFYVGITNKPVRERFEEHQSGNGSAWTRKYRPLGVVQEIFTTDRYHENNVTLKCMEKYGIENVRGGSYSKLILSAIDISSIEQQIRHNNNLCQFCGRKGHFANECFSSALENRSLNIAHRSIHQQIRSYVGACFRCGRRGHYVKDCYASTKVDGKYIGKRQ